MGSHNPVQLNTNDLPTTKSRKYIYADDICLTFQAPDVGTLEAVLNEDLAKLHEYCKTWGLKPSPEQTVSSVYHLHNEGATREPNIYLSRTKLKYAPTPTYLRVTVDRTLSFKEPASSPHYSSGERPVTGKQAG